jgi:hypothetical protein
MQMQIEKNMLKKKSIDLSKSIEQSKYYHSRQNLDSYYSDNESDHYGSNNVKYQTEKSSHRRTKTDWSNFQ